MPLLMASAMQMPDLTVGPKPLGKSERWLTSDNYPPGSLIKSGISEFELFVDRAGRAAGCRVKKSSGTADLENAACKAFQLRGRWNPAVDPNGQPIFSVFRKRIKRVGQNARGEFDPIPQYPDIEVEVARLPVPPIRAFVVVRQIQRADGTLEHCEVTSPSPSKALNAAACKLAAPLAGTEPIRDKAGNPVRGARWRIVRFMEKQPARVG